MILTPDETAQEEPYQKVTKTTAHTRTPAALKCTQLASWAGYAQAHAHATSCAWACAVQHMSMK
jgi:hypothetical protein